jgi:ferredoxin-like protein FixX
MLLSICTRIYCLTSRVSTVKTVESEIFFGAWREVRFSSSKRRKGGRNCGTPSQQTTFSGEPVLGVRVFEDRCVTFCPAGVYEAIHDEVKPANPSNCLHCKTCQRKCPFDNIRWTAPEGAGGPRYKRM